MQIVVGIAVAAYSILYWVPGSPLPDKLPWGVITQGVIFGSSNALLAMGLILVYRTTRIVNFAYGALGAMAGALTVGLFVGQGWNYWVALLAGLVVGTAAGAVVDVVVLRRFDRSSRLVATVATLGLAQVLGAIALGHRSCRLGADGLHRQHRDAARRRLLRPALSGARRPPPDARPRAGRPRRPRVVPARAPTSAGPCGPPPTTRPGPPARHPRRPAAHDRRRHRRRAVDGDVHHQGAVHRRACPRPASPPAPSSPASPSPSSPGSSRCRSRSVTGIGLGIAEWAIRWNTSAESAFNLVFLVVILVALLVQRGTQSRAEAAGERVGGRRRALRPLPRDVRDQPRVRRAGIVLWRRRRRSSPSLRRRRTRRRAPIVLIAFAFIWAMVGLSLVVLTGWGGSVSLGQFAIVGVGAMAAGNLLDALERRRLRRHRRRRRRRRRSCRRSSASPRCASRASASPSPPSRSPSPSTPTSSTRSTSPSTCPTRSCGPCCSSGSTSPTSGRPWLAAALGVLLVAVAVVRAVRRTRAGRVDHRHRATTRASPAPSRCRRRWCGSRRSCSPAPSPASPAASTSLALGGAGQGTFRPELSIEVFSYAAIGGLASAGGRDLRHPRRSAPSTSSSPRRTSAARSPPIIRLSLSGAGLLVRALPAARRPVAGGAAAARRASSLRLRRATDGRTPTSTPGARSDEDEPADEVGAIAGRCRRSTGDGRDRSREPPAAGRGPRRLVRPDAGAVRARPRDRTGARSSPCSARTAPASRRCSRRSPGCSRSIAGRVLLDGDDITGVPTHQHRRSAASCSCPAAAARSRR